MKSRLHFPAYVEMFLMGMLYREVLNFESNHYYDYSKESYGAELAWGAITLCTC